MSSSRNPSVVNDDRYVSSPSYRERIVGYPCFSAFLSISFPLWNFIFVVQIDHALVFDWNFPDDVAIDRIELVVVFSKLCDTSSMLQISPAIAINDAAV